MDGNTRGSGFNVLLSVLLLVFNSPFIVLFSAILFHDYFTPPRDLSNVVYTMRFLCVRLRSGYHVVKCPSPMIEVVYAAYCSSFIHLPFFPPPLGPTS